MAWSRFEGKALIWCIVLQALQLGAVFNGLYALGILVALQMWVGVGPYMFPPALIIYAPILGLLGFLWFRKLRPGRLRTWMAGIFYYLLLLLIWPLFLGVTCPTCVR